MNGIHDMGGMTCFGNVEPEPDEPVFHHAWERQVRALVALLMTSRYNWDEFRYAVERIEPAVYLSCSYYERWLTALERMLVENGVVSEAVLLHKSGGTAPKRGLSREQAVDKAEHIIDLAKRGAAIEPARVLSAETPVLVRNINPLGHTRVPHYVRGKRGTIDRYLGVQTFPDTNAHRLGEFRQNVYSVCFCARELWGERASERDKVFVDLWESYLEPL